MLPNGLKEILDYEAWLLHPDQRNKLPLLTVQEFSKAANLHTTLNFVKGNIHDFNEVFLDSLSEKANVVFIIESGNVHAMPELRRLFFKFIEHQVKVPVVIKRRYPAWDAQTLTLYAATDVGGLLVDGLGDGIMLSPEFRPDTTQTVRQEIAAGYNSVAFGVLQAARTRMSKTEFISCPSCGRTLFDLQETTAMIRKHTEHLKGLKIGIMGCIVNGPGEMADADYGYVGMGKDKIALYRGQTVVKRSVKADQAVGELIELIKEDGRWIEP